MVSSGWWQAGNIHKHGLNRTIRQKPVDNRLQEWHDISSQVW